MSNTHGPISPPLGQRHYASPAVTGRVVLTVGTFDLFHYGHVNFLRQARELGDYLIVGVNGDEFVERFKRPTVMRFLERMAVIVGCAYADEVVGNYGEEDLKPLIRDLHPDILVVGDDWKHKDYFAQTQLSQAFLDGYKCELVYVPYTKSISTTEIRQRILASSSQPTS